MNFESNEIILEIEKAEAEAMFKAYSDKELMTLYILGNEPHDFDILETELTRRNLQVKAKELYDEFMTKIEELFED